MDFKVPTLTTQAQRDRVAICRQCPFYLKSKALNLEFEKCNKCGCYIHLKAIAGPRQCPDGRW